MNKILIITIILIAAFSCKKKDKNPEVIAPEVLGVEGAGIKDIDGHTYKTVVIKTQEWMAENLRTSHFSNGDSIISGRTVGDITPMTSPQFFFYPNNDSLTNLNRYGRLYTHYVAGDLRNVCPNGWRVPSKSDWDTLVKNVGGDIVGGGKLKSTSYWDGPNAGADNSSLFSAVPAGYREPENLYKEVNQLGIWWTSTADTADRIWTYYIKYSYSYVFESPDIKRKALSVRCIKN